MISLSITVDNFSWYSLNFISLNWTKDKRIIDLVFIKCIHIQKNILKINCSITGLFVNKMSRRLSYNNENRPPIRPNKRHKSSDCKDLKRSKPNDPTFGRPLPLNREVPKTSQSLSTVMKRELQNKVQHRLSNKDLNKIESDLLKNHNYNFRSPPKLREIKKENKSPIKVENVEVQEQTNAVFSQVISKSPLKTESKDSSLQEIITNSTVNSTSKSDSIDSSQCSPIYFNKSTTQRLADEVDIDQEIEDEVFDVLTEIGDNFILETVTMAAKLANLRKGETIIVEDVGLALDQRWDMQFPEFGTGIDKRQTKLAAKRNKFHFL